MLCLKNGIVGWCINPCTLFLPDSLKHGLRIFSPAGDMASVTKKFIIALNSPLKEEYDCSTVVFLATQANKISLPYWIWESMAEKP